MTQVDKITAQEGFEEFRHAYRAAIKEIRTKIEILSEDFAVRHDYNPIHHMERRLKIPASIEEKLQRLGKEVSIEAARDNIFDIAGIRVVCNFVDDVYRVADMLIAQHDVTLITRKDYIENPKENGYRSLHVIITVEVDFAEASRKVPVEIQIRTIAMDFWASTEHQLRYKKDKEFTQEVQDKLKNCADIMAKADQQMQEIAGDFNLEQW